MNSFPDNPRSPEQPLAGRTLNIKVSCPDCGDHEVSISTRRGRSTNPEDMRVIYLGDTAVQYGFHCSDCNKQVLCDGKNLRVPQTSDEFQKTMMCIIDNGGREVRITESSLSEDLDFINHLPLGEHDLLHFMVALETVGPEAYLREISIN